MNPPEPGSNIFSRLANSDNQGEDLESSHALILQHAQPNDPRVYDLLVEHYGSVIFQFTGALLDNLPANRQLVLDLVRETFTYATANVTHFYGSASVKGWLVRTAVDRVHNLQKKRILGKLFSRKQNIFPRRSERINPSLSDVVEADSAQENAQAAGFASRLWDLYDLLPEKQRLLILLRLVFNLETRDIGQILNISREKMLRYLVAFRDDLSDGRLESTPQLHGQFRRQILGAWEGLLEIEPAARQDLRQHLVECADCRSYAQALQDLDAATREVFQSKWISISLDTAERENLAGGFIRRWSTPASVHQAASLLRYGAWIGLAVALFLGIAWMVNLTLPVEDRPAKNQTAESGSLPAPVEIEAKVVSSAGEESPGQGQGSHDYRLYPRLSGDGRWVVYISDQLEADPTGKTESPGVFLFDRQEGVSTSLTSRLGTGALSVSSSPPGISTDGRYIVFSVYSREAIGLVLDGELHVKPGFAVLLYNRETDTFTLVDRTPNGQPAQGSSMFPIISADGEWIAYWSDAPDITGERSESCASSACYDLFVYQRSTGKVQRVPVGRNADAGHMQVSLSGDGRYLALTLVADDRIAITMGLPHLLDAFLYNRVSGDFTSLNFASDGTPGNDATFDPQLSADGTYVAFSSSASNLVKGDTNGVQDVFVRSLENRHVERVSVSSFGRQGDYPSGSQNFGGPILDTGVSLSADGRYVAFASFAGSLAKGVLLPCLAEEMTACSLIYVHDRLTGQTQQVAGRLSTRAYSSPEISTDGQQIAYLETRKCDRMYEEHACSEVWVYDQVAGWTDTVTRAGLSHSSPEWQSSFQIPGSGSAGRLVAFSPDGQVVAAGAEDGSVQLLRTADGTAISTLRGKQESPITSIAFSPNGRLLAAGVMPGTVDVWRLPDQQLLYTLENHPDEIAHLTFSADGTILVAGGKDAIWVWELKGKIFQRISVLKYPEGFVADVAISPNKAWLAVAGEDETVWIQKIPSGKLVLRLGGQFKAANSVAFSPGGNYLAVGSQDQSVNLWDTSALSQASGSAEQPSAVAYIHTFWHPEAVSKVSFSADGYQLLTLAADKWLRSWNLADRTFQAALFEKVDAFASTASGGILTVGEGNSVVRLWGGVIGVADPRFFRRSPTEQVNMSLDEPPVSDSGNANLMEFRVANGYAISSIYQAADLADFPLQVPAYLPPGVAFYGAFHTSDGAVIISYDYRTAPPGSQEYGSILLCQRTLEMDESACGGWIGKNAIVESVSIDERSGLTGEAISGDWYTDVYASQNATGKIILTWNPDHSTRWLRWQVGKTIATLVAKASPENIPFSIDDLIAIASSLMPLDDLSTPDQVVVHYRVQEGDTCQGIASQFGVNIRDIIDLNGLSGGCDMIWPGQIFVVPLPQERKTIGEADLNCDGKTERLQVIGYARNASQGLVLDSQGWNGLYTSSWTYTFDQVGGGSFRKPEFIPVDGCQQLVAVNFFGLNPGSDRFLVFRWDGSSMTAVLDASGSAAPEISPQGPLPSISVQKRAIDVSTGECQMTTVDYGWDGSTFNRLGARSGEPCTP